jgi:hypothetical protein
MKDNPKLSCSKCPYRKYGFYSVSIEYPDEETYYIWTCRLLLGTDQSIPDFWDSVEMHAIHDYPTPWQLENTGCEFGDSIAELYKE